MVVWKWEYCATTLFDQIIPIINIYYLSFFVGPSINTSTLKLILDEKKFDDGNFIEW